jgi:hypothetical protein
MNFKCLNLISWSVIERIWMIKPSLAHKLIDLCVNAKMDEFYEIWEINELGKVYAWDKMMNSIGHYLTKYRWWILVNIA